MIQQTHSNFGMFAFIMIGNIQEIVSATELGLRKENFAFQITKVAGV